MKYIIILVVVGFILWKTRPFIKGWLISRQLKKIKVEPIKDDFIYTPIRSSRTFTFDLTVDELGNGKVKIGVAHKKEI